MFFALLIDHTTQSKIDVMEGATMKLYVHRLATSFQSELKPRSNTLTFNNNKLITYLSAHCKKLSLKNYTDIIRKINDN